MASNQNSNKNDDQSQGLENTVKNPDDWKTGDEPMTGAQRSYVHTLASDVDEEVDDNMTKAEASKKIDALRQEAGVADRKNDGHNNEHNS